MSIFNIVFLKTCSVLLSVLIGFIAGKYSNVERDSIATLLFSFISPIVFFTIPASSNFNMLELSITFITFCISSTLAIITYNIIKRYWQDYTRNILAWSSGTANNGYFMLPIATALFDDYTLNIYTTAIIGINIYESSVGFYLCTRNLHSTKESIKKILKLPMLHAFVWGCIFSFVGFKLPNFLNDFIYNIKGTYSILGMIMIGLGLSTLRTIAIDVNFTLACFCLKFIIYPIMVNIFIICDKYIFNLYSASHYEALRLLSFSPLAAGMIIIASRHKFNVEKVATTVLLSLIFALIYIPIMVGTFIKI